MEAKGSRLDLGDLLMIYARKFLRLAPVYYTMWPVIWALSSRMVEGPRAYISDINMADCSTDWPMTAMMIGNLSPSPMKPWTGCYQQAWPLQLDMQLTLVAPILVMLVWKLPRFGMLVCVSMIVGNIFINFQIAKDNDLKIGFLYHSNYFMLTTLLSKPWTKLANLGFGVLLAYVYT